MDTSEVTYRWVNGIECSVEEWNKMDSLLEMRGVISLNRNTCRILLAEDALGLKGFLVMQHVPFLGPLLLIPSARGKGIAGELADQMISFMLDAGARGWLVVAESKHTVKLCEERGFQRLEFPVYVVGNPGGVDVEDAVQQSSSPART